MDSAPRSNDAALRHDADRFLGTLLDAPVHARRAMLDALKTSDPELFVLVDSLFAHFEDVDDDDGFLAQPLSPPPDDGDGHGAEVVGMRFGHWQVVKPIGRGGMGLVFEVERADGVVRQRAALKLIRRSNDHRSIVARFHTERQILAQLDHPSIARLIDAGAADDRPYLVMEYVDGVPLDRWCVDQALSIESRIELFNRICAAVHYAHQRLVVHRDLKPSNILVIADGTPKLLDFGISKLVGADGAGAASAETIDASALLTPRYASPEQLMGAPISTASDVYSLGVLLFELLTGVGPYRTQNDSLIEMMRVVMNEEPTRASSSVGDHRARRLSGDLDLILAKALAKDAGDRYESVAALRDDLVRHLAGEPIEAAPLSWRYRATKFVTRHRTAVAATAVFFVALAGLAFVASWEALRAERALVVADEQRTRAEQRFEDTRNLAKTMLFDLNDAIAKGPTKAREELVRTALTYLDRLSLDRLSPELQQDVASGYERIAEILGNQGVNNLGRAAEAKQYLLKALAIRRRLSETDPENRENLAGLVNVNQNLAELAQFGGDPQGSAGYYRTATAASRELLRQQPDDEKALFDFFAARRNEALILFTPGRPSLQRFADALAAVKALQAEVEAYIASHPPSPRQQYFLEMVLTQRSLLERTAGDAAAALVTGQRVVALDEAALRLDPGNPLVKRDLALSVRKVGESLLQIGQFDAGIDQLRRSLTLRRELLAADPANARAMRDMAQGHASLGSAYALLRRPREALTFYEARLELAETAARREPDNVGKALDAAEAAYDAADARLAAGDRSLALTASTRTVERLVALVGPLPEDDVALETLGEARMVLARSLAATGRPLDGFAEAKEGLSALTRNAGNVPQDAFAARNLAHAELQAATIGLISGPVQHAEACALAIASRNAFNALLNARHLSAQFALIVQDARSTAAHCERGH